MYLTCNPGGVGHAWVKRLFVDRDFREGEAAADYLFIPAKVYDNTALLERSPEYLVPAPEPAAEAPGGMAGRLVERL